MLGLASGRQTVASADVKINVDNEGLSADLRRAEGNTKSSFHNIEREASSASRGALAGSGLFHTFGRSIAFASASFLGAAGLTMAVRGFVEEALNSQKVTAQTNAVLASTGSVAGITARGIDELATSLMQKTGVDDEAIRSSENLILTFTNVRNEAGKGNDIFNQTTKAALDMSVALGQDLQSSTLQLGKALNDPIRGMTQLRREGVSFTAQQQEQVKALVNSGHVLEAQKIILAEVRKEFGNSAEAAGKTFGGQINILRQNIMNLGGEIAADLLPQVQHLVTKLTEWVKSIQDGGKNHEQFERILRKVANTVSDLVGYLTDTFRVINRVANAFGGWKDVLTVVVPGIIAVKTAIMAVRTAELLAEAANPFTAIYVAAVIAAGLVITHWEKVKTFFRNLWSDIKLYASELWEWLEKSALNTALSVLEPFSHLPGFMGKWARDAKDEIKSKLYDLTVKDAIDAGSRAAAGFTAAYSKVLSNPGSVVLRRGGTVVSAGASQEVQRSLITTGKKALGVPYQYGGTPSLSSPTDCSGLMVAIFAKNGITLPRTSQAQYDNAPIKVPLNQILPGDLVFSEGMPHPGHVGLYIGDGQVLEDPHTGDKVKIISLAAFGASGAARWWGGKKTGTKTATTPTPTPTYVPHDDTPVVSKKTAKKTTKANEPPLVPLDIQIGIAKAEGTGSPSKQVAAYNRELSYLNTELDKTNKTSQRYLDLLNERNSVRDKIKSLKKTGTSSTDKAADELDLQLANAEATATLDDDLTVYNRQLESINRKLRQSNISLQDRASLIRQRTQIQKSISDIREQTFEGKHTTDALVGSVEAAIGRANQTISAAQNGGVISVDPNTGQISQKTATASDIQREIDTLKGVYKTTANSYNSIAQIWAAESGYAFKDANGRTHRPKAAKYRNSARAEWAKGQMQTLMGELDNITSALDALGAEYEDLTKQKTDTSTDSGSSAAASPADIIQQHQQDLLTLPTGLSLDTARAQYTNYGSADQSFMLPYLQNAESYYQQGLSDPNATPDTQIQLMQNIEGIRDQIKQIIANQQQALTVLPDNLQLALTEAQYYTPKDMADDIKALQDDLSYYLNNLTKATDVQTRITLMNNIIGIRSQLDTMIQQQDDANDIQGKIHDLLALRADLVSRYAGNIFSPVFGASRLGDVAMLPDSVQKAVTIIQNFTSQPEEPFSWLRQSQFAADAIFG